MSPQGFDFFLDTWPFFGSESVTNAIWKECSNLAPLTVGQNITIYGTTLTVTAITPSEIILSEADETRVWSIPNWPWTSSGV